MAGRLLSACSWPHDARFALDPTLSIPAVGRNTHLLATVQCSGKASPDDVIMIASAGISVAIRKDAPKPDISSPEALKRTLLAAQSISYVDPTSGGASGIHFVKVLDRLGIANEMRSKTVFPNSKTPAEVGALVANGEAEIGIHIIVELISVAGIELVGRYRASCRI